MSGVSRRGSYGQVLGDILKDIVIFTDKYRECSYDMYALWHIYHQEFGISFDRFLKLVRDEEEVKSALLAAREVWISFKDFMKLYSASDFNLSFVAKHLGVSRRSLMEIIDDRLDLQYAMEDARNIQIDMWESKLSAKALEGDTVALRFLLSNLAKDRGYGTESRRAESSDGRYKEIIDSMKNKESPVKSVPGYENAMKLVKPASEKESPSGGFDDDEAA